MRYYRNGIYHSVNISAEEVEKFKQTWPDSGIPAGHVWFEFDRRNGDCVRIRPEGTLITPAMLSLLQQARLYAQEKEQALVVTLAQVQDKATTPYDPEKLRNAGLEWESNKPRKRNS
jgi:hypothetical protein